MAEMELFLNFSVFFSAVITISIALWIALKKPKIRPGRAGIVLGFILAMVLNSLIAIHQYAYYTSQSLAPIASVRCGGILTITFILWIIIALFIKLIRYAKNAIEEYGFFINRRR